jgi:beta-alanine degradation protein BauB
LDDVSSVIPQFGNQDVRVSKSVMAPGQAWPLHRHNHPRVVVALVGGEVTFVGRSGETTTQRFETGTAYWLAADPAGTYHREENAGKTPIELMLTELERAH